MTSTHLLSLATMNREGPGSLDVVFGPDGDFPGAPEWRCQIWDSEDGPDGDWMGISRHALHPIADQFDPLDAMFFDCRLPSVAARLAGLCARAMGEPHGDGWIVTLNGDWCLQSPRGSRAFNWYGNGRPYDALGVLPSAPIIASSVAGFLAALTLSLAPKIAALGASR